MMIRNTRGVLGPEICQDVVAASHREWLETDGLGGYASGTVGGVRTRRYHGLLLVATKPPTERRILVNGAEEFLVVGNERIGLSAQRYAPDVLNPRGLVHLAEFHLYPWPTWIFTLKLKNGETVTLEKELFCPRNRPMTVITWRLVSGPAATLEVRPLLSGRDIHTAHHRNETLSPTCFSDKGRISWHPYQGVPRVFAHHNGDYHHAPEWYAQFLYAAERERGLDHVEDLWAPGTIAFSLKQGVTQYLAFTTEDSASLPMAALKRAEKVRREKVVATPKTLVDELERAVDNYLVQRGTGRTICAGYPWFTDWGRDTFISMRGLCLATGRFEDARHILLEWAKTVDLGMLPNRFPDEGDKPEFNSVDASLWFVVVAREYLELTKFKDLARLRPALLAIMDGYQKGTRFGIKMDSDGLITAGETGTQLTWMDAKYESTCYTPRMGKPVEIQALWINALAAMEALSKKAASPKAASSKSAGPNWAAMKKTAIASFRKRFWNEDARCLFDVIDGPGGDDSTIRPNQLFAISLAEPILDPAQAKSVVDCVEKSLVTPMGLRTRAFGPGYIGRYTAGRRERDAAYHNGTVWPWLFGPFIEAWVKVRKDKAKAKKDALRFLGELDKHIADAGLGHVTEVADGDHPHEPKGCPWQAWSVAEPLRLMKMVLKVSDIPASAPRSEKPVSSKKAVAAKAPVKTPLKKTSIPKKKAGSRK